MPNEKSTDIFLNKKNEMNIFSVNSLKKYRLSDNFENSSITPILNDCEKDKINPKKSSNKKNLRSIFNVSKNNYQIELKVTNPNLKISEQGCKYSLDRDPRKYSKYINNQNSFYNRSINNKLLEDQKSEINTLTNNNEIIKNHFSININNNVNLIMIDNRLALKKFKSLKTREIKSILNNTNNKNKIKVSPLDMSQASKKSIEKIILPACIKTRGISLLDGNDFNFKVSLMFF